MTDDPNFTGADKINQNPQQLQQTEVSNAHAEIYGNQGHHPGEKVKQFLKNLGHVAEDVGINITNSELRGHGFHVPVSHANYLLANNPYEGQTGYIGNSGYPPPMSAAAESPHEAIIPQPLNPYQPATNSRMLWLQGRHDLQEAVTAQQNATTDQRWYAQQHEAELKQQAWQDQEAKRIAAERQAEQHPNVLRTDVRYANSAANDTYMHSHGGPNPNHLELGPDGAMHPHRGHIEYYGNHSVMTDTHHNDRVTRVTYPDGHSSDINYTAQGTPFDIRSDDPRYPSWSSTDGYHWQRAYARPGDESEPGAKAFAQKFEGPVVVRPDGNIIVYGPNKFTVVDPETSRDNTDGYHQYSYNDPAHHDLAKNAVKDLLSKYFKDMHPNWQTGDPLSVTDQDARNQADPSKDANPVDRFVANGLFTYFQRHPEKHTITNLDLEHIADELTQ